MKKKIILFSSVAFFLITCTNEKGPVPTVATVGECSAPHSYNDVIAPMIATYCATQSGCHGPSPSAPGVYNSYASIKADVDNTLGTGSIYDRVFGTISAHMPMPSAPPLPTAQQNLLKCWLADGAPQTGTAVATTTCPTIISYSVTIAPLVATNCAVSGCHVAGGSGNGVYTSYDALKLKVDNGSLNNRVVVLKDMPKFPVLPLPAADISNIDCWIKQGAPNN